MRVRVLPRVSNWLNDIVRVPPGVYGVIVLVWRRVEADAILPRMTLNRRTEVSFIRRIRKGICLRWGERQMIKFV